MPVVFPAVVALGFNPVWFGIIIVKVIEFGLLTLPVGLDVFMMKSVATDIALQTVFRGPTWFCVADLIRIALPVSFPQIALILPNAMLR